jgi:hypothetical protein
VIDGRQVDEGQIFAGSFGQNLLILPEIHPRKEAGGSSSKPFDSFQKFIQENLDLSVDTNFESFVFVLGMCERDTLQC